MITSEDFFENFKFTMSGLEKGLQVIHITTPADKLLCCQQNERVEDILIRSELKPYDQIPVKEQETMIGLLNKRECPQEARGSVKDYMQPLGEQILVSADTSLLEFIQSDTLDRLVIKSTKIYGLVTRSDLLKLPTSLLGFALVTHIETLMLAIIRSTNISKQEWLMLLSSSRQQDIQKRFNQLAIKRSDPDMLELTYFSDKNLILQKLHQSKKYASFLPDKSYIDQLTELKTLRNTIAHIGNASDDHDILQEFIDRLRIAHNWIKSIEQWKPSYTRPTP